MNPIPLVIREYEACTMVNCGQSADLSQTSDQVKLLQL